MARRSKGRLVALVVALLIVGGVATNHFLGKMRERIVFVSTLDPASSVRCRFTVSPGWKCTVGKLERSGNPSDQRLDDVTFDSPQEGPVWQWIESHLLHRPPAERCQIRLSTQKGRNASDLPDIEGGYPEPGIYHHDHVVSLRRLQIDGYPATIAEMEGIAYTPTSPDHWTTLRVYVPQSSILYTLERDSDAPNSTICADEMKAIIASFHVEKAAPTGVKR